VLGHLPIKWVSLTGTFLNMQQDFSVPSYYIANPSVAACKPELIRQLLSITPISQIFITNLDDVETALLFNDSVYRVASLDQAKELALSTYQEFQHPSLILGEAHVIEAYFEDGHSEQMHTHVLDCKGDMK